MTRSARGIRIISRSEIWKGYFVGFDMGGTLLGPGMVGEGSGWSYAWDHSTQIYTCTWISEGVD